MATARLRDFVGIAPKLSSRLRPKNSADIADNTDLSSGEIRPWRDYLKAETPVKQNELLSIYRYDPTGAPVWMHWNEDVDVARGPVAGDTSVRVFFTGLDKPRVADNTMVDSTAAASSTNITGATNADPCVITEGLHDLVTGMEITLSAFVGITELNAQKITITKIDDNNYSLDGVDSTGYGAYVSGGTWVRTLGGFPEASFVLGIPAPTTKPTTAVTGAAGGTPITRAYVYTYISEWGEEGPPSPAGDDLTVEDGQTVDITNMNAAPVGDYNIFKWRIYRALSGTAGAEYQYVAEVMINANTPQYNDSIADTVVAKNEVLQTTEWDPPPAGMKGIISLPNGVLAGFIGNQVCMSYPNAPHAWPVPYRKVTDYPIVSIGHYGTTIVVGTEGTTYLIQGSNPALASMTDLPQRQPCVSKRGMTRMAGGVAYPSPDGMFVVGPRGSQLITRDIFSRVNWQALKPATMHSYTHDERMFVFYDTGLVNGVRQGSGFVLESINDKISASNLMFYASAGHVDPTDGALYFVIWDGAAHEIYQWEGAGTRMNTNWKSSELSINKPVNMAAAQVIGDYAPSLTQEEQDALTVQRDALIAANQALITAGVVYGAINGQETDLYEINGDSLAEVPPAYAIPETINFELFADGVSKFLRTVGNSRPFRLPGGYQSAKYNVRVSGKVHVQDITLATTVQELQQI